MRETSTSAKSSQPLYEMKLTSSNSSEEKSPQEVVVNLDDRRKRKVAPVTEPSIEDQADRIVTVKLAYRDGKLIGGFHSGGSDSDSVWKLIDDLTAFQRWLGKKATKLDPTHDREIIATSVVRRGGDNSLWLSDAALGEPEESRKNLTGAFSKFVEMVKSTFRVNN